MNRTELAICKRRGHDSMALEKNWRRCKWCGMWLREVRTIEEREDDPPENQRSVFEALSGPSDKKAAKKVTLARKRRTTKQEVVR